MTNRPDVTIETARFFDLAIDMTDGVQWLLDAPTTGGPGFTFGFYSVGERRDGVVATTTVLRPGVPQPLSWTQSMVPVVTEEVRDLIEEVTPGAVQWVPLEIEGHPEPRFLMNILHLIDCIDVDRSVGKQRPPGDEKGGWSSLTELHVKADLDPECDVFRVAGFSVIIVISGRLKEALDAAGVRSMRYVALE